MGKSRLILVFLLLLAFTLPAAASVCKRTAPGSYVPTCVRTVDELCKLVSHNQTVANRFARHFGIPASEVIQYFRENLKVDYLKHGGRYRTFFIDRSGKMISHSVYLITGEKVFVTQDGKPVLIAKCGNPVSKVLPSVMPKNEARAPVTQPELIVDSPNSSPVLVADGAEMEPTSTAPVMLVAAEPIAELPLIPAITPLLPIAKQSGLLVPFLLGAGSFVPDHHKHVVTPEPSSMLMLAFGGIPMLAGAVKSRRRRSA